MQKAKFIVISGICENIEYSALWIFLFFPLGKSSVIFFPPPVGSSTGNIMKVPCYSL